MAPEHKLDSARLFDEPRLHHRPPDGVTLGYRRYRYLEERPEALSLWTTPLYEEVTQRLAEGEGAGIFIDSMHMEVLYHLDSEVPEPNQSGVN